MVPQCPPGITAEPYPDGGPTVSSAKPPMSAGLQVYPRSLRDVLGMLMMVPVSTGLSIVRAIGQARR